MKNRLEEYSFIAQIVSAVAIVLSLIFVGMQVRMGAQETAANSLAVRSAVQQAMMEADKDMLLFRAEFPELSPQQASNYYTAFLRTRLLYWSQHESGLLDDANYLSYMYALVAGALRNNDLMRSHVLDAINPPGAYPAEFVTEIHRLWAELNPDLPPLSEYTVDCELISC